MIGYLNNIQKEVLSLLMNMIISPDEKRRMPGAAEIDFSSYLENEQTSLKWLEEGIEIIIEESNIVFGKDFQLLMENERNDVINKLRIKLNRFFYNLGTHVIQCYYQDERVLKALGLECRAPFPDGFNVPDGDFTLLEQVYKRGEIYRS